MFKDQGFTLFELLITLCIAALILGLAIPNFSHQLQKTRVHTATQELRQAIETARTIAVMKNKRTLLAAKKEWHQGWTLFIDLDNDGAEDADEPVVMDTAALEGITISGNSSVKQYISFISTGEGRKAGKADAGAFISGTLNICPKQPGDGYKLVLSRGGRVRSQSIKANECSKNA